MTFILYRAFLQPISLLFTFSFGLFSKKMRKSLKLRLSKDFKLLDSSRDSKPVWIHCSSGEFEYAKPVLRLLKQNNYKTLVTFYSPSHVKQVLASSDVDYVHPLPFDLPGPLQSFIKHFKPQALLFARTDVWPELSLQAKQQKIPSLLFSRTQKDLSSLKKIFTRWSYKNLKTISCVSDTDKENLNFLKETTVKVDGDTRFDEIIHRKKQNKDIKNLNSNQFALVLGSVWTEDIKAIIDDRLLNYIKRNNIHLIVAPHEINKNSLQEVGHHLNSHYQLYSQIKDWQGQKPLIIDEYGLLFEVYKYADLSFVGGSFKKNVHSVMEPIAWGSPVVIGPYNKNNREAQDFKSKNISNSSSTPIVKEIHSSEDLIKHIENLRRTKTNTKEFINQLVISKTGASEKVFDWVQKKTRQKKSDA